MNQDQSITNPLNASFTDQSLAQVCARSPVVKRIINSYGTASLVDYLRQVLIICEKPLQPRQDLLEAVHRYSGSLLGETVAEQVVQDLQTLPAVLTANHHGVDFLAQSVQGSLFFSLREVGGKSAKTVPVFACGNVALNNPAYPRGLLLYDVNRYAIEFNLPIRLPIFSDRDKRKAVSIVGAFDLKMVAKARQRLAALAQSKQLNSNLAAAAIAILNENYQDKFVIGLKNYSQQAVVLNNRIWKQCFKEPDQIPELVYLELEKITNNLLYADLNNEDSLVWQMMFNPKLRKELLNQLDGARACWNQGKLAQQIYYNSVNHNGFPSGSGTIFFWAIDNSGRKVPLLLAEDSNHAAKLHGRDEHGNFWTIPFNSKEILNGLQVGKLLPSLFTCYATIGFARGISCCGGYFQAEYLVAMQHGLIMALHNSAECLEFAHHLSHVPCNIYLSGMQAVMRNQNDELLLPAGPVEMIAGGGLSRDQLDRVRSLTVRDVHLAGLIETFTDFQPIKDHSKNWLFFLANESFHLLADRILII